MKKEGFDFFQNRACEYFPHVMNKNLLIEERIRKKPRCMED